MGGKQSHSISAKYNSPASVVDPGAADFDRTKRRRGGGGGPSASTPPRHPQQRQQQHRRVTSGASDATTSNTTHTNNSNNNGSARQQQQQSSWIHYGVDIQDVYDVHEVIAYGLLGPIQMCSRKRQQHSNHTGDLIVIQQHQNNQGNTITKSDRTGVSSDSSLSAPISTKAGSSPGSAGGCGGGGGGSYHRLYACKHISTSRLKQGAIDALLQEVQALHDVQQQNKHPNIASIKEVYVTKGQVSLILDLCTGGDLFTRMDVTTEIDVVDVLEQIVDAIAFLHHARQQHEQEQHCSSSLQYLELENVMYEHAGSNAGIKLVDFGLSDKYGRCQQCRNVVGARYAAAPETFVTPDGNDNSETAAADSDADTLPSTDAADIWSIGVIAYCMLSGGSYPFGTDRELDMDRLLANTDSENKDDTYVTFGAEWDERGISETARSFCRRCLVRDPSRRWTANEALVFIKEWMTTVETYNLMQPSEALPPPPALDVSLRGVQDFGLYGQRRKRLLTMLATTMDKSALEELKEVLVDYDKDQSGVLTLQQVKRAVKQYCREKGDESELTKEDMKEMLKGCHQDRSRTIEYEPFLKAVLQMQGTMTQERLGDAFDRADPEGNGLLQKDEMKRIIGPNGADMTIVDQVLEEADCEAPNGMVEYDVFLNRLFQDPGAAMDHVSRTVGDPM